MQQTADYIFALEQEKTQLLAQNNQLKRFIQVTVGHTQNMFIILDGQYIERVRLTVPCHTNYQILFFIQNSSDAASHQ